LPERIASLSRQRGLSKQAAAREVRKIDRERMAFVRDAFLKDARDPLHYDQVINAARFSVEGCAGVIVAAMHQVQAETARGPEVLAESHAAP
jgi:hypothetical protein